MEVGGELKVSIHTFPQKASPDSPIKPKLVALIRRGKKRFLFCPKALWEFCFSWEKMELM